ncbi:hypothetical protein CGLO_08809 [Colletotrichum gloeosporioides Cg-14]|uniref:Uncharacterized protein n=1 Tax=Colletotrichum gloeosporioides (strain Cg-14) TaxID=1237896 RepID=T0LJ71_COLGC|nr:hypothetical protein CGLO_08809 [Colletotrichum gloeosporioides Cg-14]
MAAGKHLQRYDYDTAKHRKATAAAAAANMANMANGIIVATATHATASLSPVCTANAELDGRYMPPAQLSMIPHHVLSC